MTAALVDIGAIEAAAQRLAGRAVITPLLESQELNDRTGGRILLKPECLQRTGSFKFRGAFNKISQIPSERARHGVVAFSSGNHAQGVAAAARIMGLPAAIVMPADAPTIKIENTRGYGAELVLYDRYSEDREAVAAKLADERGAVMVRPYDDRDIIAGQGTLGLEIVGQSRQLGAPPDVVLVPCGGGGLIAGTAIAVKQALPSSAIYAVEPAAFDDTGRSLRAHRRLANEAGGATICDALMAAMPGELTFAINDRLLAGGLSIDDREVAAAVGYAFGILKLVVEPGGAVALAAVLAGKIDVRGRTVAVVLSGGNIDSATFCRLTRPGEATVAAPG